MTLSKSCILFVCFLFVVNAQGPDPWDGRKKVHNCYSDEKNLKDNNGSGNTLSDTFYKRILQLIVNRGRFKNTANQLLEGYLHFEFSSREFDLLKKYSSLTVPLSAKELREIDGLLADKLVFPSIAQIYLENFIDYLAHLIKTYYVHFLLVAGFFVLVYFFRYINWSLIFTIRSFIIIFLFLCVLWEIKLELEKSKYIQYVKKSEPSWWNFWNSGNEIVFTEVKTIYETLHPVDIAGNICHKILFKPIKGFMNFLDTYTDHISGKFWMPFDSIVYMFITMSYIVIIVIACVSFVFYLIFGVAINLSYLGFTASFKKQKRDSFVHIPYTSSVNQNISNSADNNFRALIDLCSKLVDNKLEPKPQPDTRKSFNFEIKNVETDDSLLKKRKIKRVRTLTH